LQKLVVKRENIYSRVEQEEIVEFEVGFTDTKNLFEDNIIFNSLDWHFKEFIHLQMETTQSYLKSSGL
jgi:hypothetical protein